MYPFLAFLNLLIAVDNDEPDADYIGDIHHPACYQSESMYHTVMVDHYTYDEMGIALTALGLLLPTDAWIAPYSPCRWRGVTCVKDVLRVVRWDSRIRLKGMDIGWFPASVSAIEIDNILPVISVPFETRKLPRDLEHFSLMHCRWRRTIDLTTLPPRLESFTSVHNDFEGTLVLTRLPYTLERVCIIRGTISLICIDNGSLPENFCEFILETEGNFKVKSSGSLDRRITVKRFDWRNQRY